MNVCLIWDSEYPWDVRLEKVARSLSAAGHRVDIAARNRTRLPLVEALPEGTVHRMPPMPGRSDRMEAALSFPAFVNPRWFALVHAVATKGPADVIVCRDLPLAPIAIAAGRRLGRPVVLDLAENYPAMIQAVWDHGRQRPWDWLVRNPRAARAVERWVVRRVDHTIVVVEESRDRLVELGVDPDRITVSLNTPLGERIPARVEPVTPGLPLRLVYIGLLEAPRGLSVVLRALARCRDEDVPVQIEVVGDGRDRKILEDESAALGLGWILPINVNYRHLEVGSVISPRR